jgi:hypothetical protein
MLQLQSNVPMPRRKIDRRRKYPFERMSVGDFFFVPGKKRNSIRTYFATAGKEHGIKLKSELIYAHQTSKGWAPCEKDTPGAQLGVGVWRTE